MTAITISPVAKRPLESARHVRNGFIPASEFQDKLAELAGYAANIRAKVIFSHHGSLATGGLGSAIPNSASLGAERVRARSSWRSGPYAQYLFVRATLARQNNGTPTSPFVRVRVRDENNTIVGDAFARGGSATGASDTPNELTTRTTVLIVSDSDTNIVELTPDTDYFLAVTEHDYARLQDVTVYEVSLVPDTDNGYPARNQPPGSPILDSDRNDTLLMGRETWIRGGAHLWNWWCDVPSQARNSTSSTYKNLIDDSSTTTTHAPGARFNLIKRDRSNSGLVPVVMKVYATDTDGSVRLVNSSGVTQLEVDIDNGEGWYAVTGTLPATDARYLLHYGTNDDLTVEAVSLYQAIEFDAWSEADFGLALSIDGEPEPVEVSDSITIDVPLVVSGGDQTTLELDVAIAYPDQTAPTAPTNFDLDGWTMSSAWAYNAGTDKYEATFTKASQPEGLTTLVFTAATGTVTGTITLSAAVTSDQASDTATNDTITVGAAITFDALVTTPTDGSSFDCEIGTAALPVTVQASVVGSTQTNAEFTAEVWDSFGSAKIAGIATSALDGWSETGWALSSGVWSNTFTKASATVGTYDIEFDVDFINDGTALCDVTIATNATFPSTDQTTGLGNDVTAHIQNAALALAIGGSYTDGDMEEFFELGNIEADRGVRYSITVTATGDHTDAEVVVTFAYRDGTHAGFVTPLDMATIESELEDVNSGWTVDADDSSGSGPLVITFSRASLPEGEYGISIPLFDGEVDFPLGKWQWGTSSTPGGLVYYGTASGGFEMAGGSNEIATATGGQVRTVEVGDLYQSVGIAPDPATEDEEVIIQTETTVYSASSAGTITMVFQITDAVTCSEPTIDSNPSSWSQSGGWTSPGGGIQWQGTFTKSSVVSEGSYRIDFATTPSTTGTLAALATSSWSLIPYEDVGTDDATVDPGIAWTVDATSGIGTPLNETEAEALLTDAGVVTPNVTSLWKFGTPASGNVPDTIGAVTLTASGTLAYQQTVTGWTLQSLKTTANTSGIVENASGVSNVNANVYTVFLLARVNATVAATRSLCRLGANFDSDACLELTTTPRLQVGRGGISGRTAGGSDPTGSARWYALRVGASSVDGFTSQEKIITGAKGCSGTRVTFGGDNTQTWFPNTTDYMLGFITPVELTNTEIKAVLTSLGESPGWSP